jgi:hypothetical protein
MQGVPETAAHPGHAPTITYYALKYAASAPPGLPPVVHANWFTVEDSSDGPWVGFFLAAPPTSSAAEPLCILRIHQSHLATYSEHRSLLDALTQA